MPRSENSSSHIQPQTLALLEHKLFSGNTTWAERATLMYFLFDMEIAQGREWADALEGLVKALQKKFPTASNREILSTIRELVPLLPLLKPTIAQHAHSHNFWKEISQDLKQARIAYSTQTALFSVMSALILYVWKDIPIPPPPSSETTENNETVTV